MRDEREEGKEEGGREGGREGGKDYGIKVQTLLNSLQAC